MLRGTLLCAALLAGLAGSSGCPAGEPCGDGPACDDDERCREGACAPAAPPALVSVERFTATPSRVSAGGPATLTWATKNAATCLLSPSFGAVPRSGSAVVQPATSTTYTLRCEGAGGPAEAAAEVSVLGGLDGGLADGGALDGGTLDGGALDGGPFDDASVPDDAHALGDGGALSSDIVASEGVDVMAQAPGALDDGDAAAHTLLFRERAAVTLEAWYMADSSYPARWGAAGDLGDGEPRVQLVPGQVLDAWLLRSFSPTAEARAGSVTFAREIVAVSWRAGTLSETQAIFAAPDVDYGAPASRGFELAGDDRFTLSDDRRTLTFTASGAGPDEMRVLVDKNPETRPRVQTWTVTSESVTDLRGGAWQNQDHALLLDEGVTTLGGAMPVNIGAAGRYHDSSVFAGALDPGTVVRSWIFHFNPSSAAAENLLTVSVTFERPLLGILTEGGALSFTDSALGGDDVVYPSINDNRGLELGASEGVWWSEDGRSLRLTFRVPAAGGIDQVRVLTEP